MPDRPILFSGPLSFTVERRNTLQASINRGARRTSTRFKLTPAAPAPIDNEALVEEVARAIYARRPFIMASTETLNGVQIGKSFDWDGAPAYYQSDILDLARAVLALPSIASSLQKTQIAPALVEETIRALSNARRILAFQPHPLTAAHADEKRGALAEIDATLAKLKEGRVA